MLNKTSKKFKIDFLSEFTKEILRGTDSYLKIKIKEFGKKPEPGEKFKETGKTQEEEKEIKKIVSEKLKKNEEVFKKTPFKKEDWIPSRNLINFTKNKKEFPKKDISERIDSGLKIPRLRIQEPTIPSTIRDITPVPNEKSIEVGKLAPLIRDPLVKTIETYGPNQSVYVTGMMGHKPTPIQLNQNEIQSIIKKFSEEAKIPFEEGFFKAAVGRLTISAIISETTGSKFAITKIGRPTSF